MRVVPTATMPTTDTMASTVTAIFSEQNAKKISRAVIINPPVYFFARTACPYDALIIYLSERQNNTYGIT